MVKHLQNPRKPANNKLIIKLINNELSHFSQIRVAKLH